MFAQQLVNGLILGSVYALIALGYTMVYGILFFINFAHGDIYMVGAFVALWMATFAGRAGFLPILVLSMLGAALLGITVERFAYRPLRKAPRLAPLLSALGVSILLENLFIKIQGPQYRAFPAHFFSDTRFTVGTIQITFLQLVIICTTAALTLGLTLFIRKTRWGKAIRATSENRTAAGLMGIDVNKSIALTFFIGSLLAGAAGTLIGLYFNAVFPLMGWMPGMKGFIAAVLGGIGNLPGAVLGGVILGIAEVMTVGYLSSSYRDAVAFAILIAILLFKPDGILGKPYKGNL
jgi:branched-chain amino acid transport system permease protein